MSAVGVDLVGATLSSSTLVQSSILSSEDALPPRNVMREEVPELDGKCVPALHRACRDGKPSLVTALLRSEQADLFQKDAAHQTALHFACGSSEPDAAEVVALLLRRGMSPNDKDFMGCTSLHNAVRMQRDDLVDLILGGFNQGNSSAAPANVNASDCRMDTPLHYAARGGHRGIVKRLLAHGAHFEVLNRANKTPLMLAKDRGDIDMVELFLAHKDDQRQD